MATRDAEPRPVLGTPDDYPDRPDKRRGRFVMHLVVGVLTVVFAGGWGYVMWSATGNATVTKQVISFDARKPDRASITFEVAGLDDRAIVCQIRAVDEAHVEVGTLEVKIPAGAGYTRLKESLATSAQASSVEIQYCSPVS